MQLTHDIDRACHVMACYRGYLVGRKRQWGTARGLIHYGRLVGQWVLCRQLLVALRQQT